MRRAWRSASAAVAPAACGLTAAACAAGAGWIAVAPEGAAWMSRHGAATAAVMAALWAGGALWLVRRARSERLAAILVRA